MTLSPLDHLIAGQPAAGGDGSPRAGAPGRGGHDGSQRGGNTGNGSQRRPATPAAESTPVDPTAFAPVEELAAELRAGRMIVVCDDPDRENEGDLIVAAEHITPANMGFIVRYTGGVACLALTGERASTRWACRRWSAANEARARARPSPCRSRRGEGVTTGISAA
jgi:hypothetical protein